MSQIIHPYKKGVRVLLIIYTHDCDLCEVPNSSVIVLARLVLQFVTSEAIIMKEEIC